MSDLHTRTLKLANSLPEGDPLRKKITALVQQEGGEVRDGFYAAADGIQRLQDTTRHLTTADGRPDRTYNRLIKNLEKAFDEVNNHLNANYLWD